MNVPTRVNTSVEIERLACALRARRIWCAVSGSEAFKTTTSMFNGAVNRRVQLAVRPVTSSELRAVVREVRQHGLTISIRGGGHGVAGGAVSGTVMIDMSAFRSMTYDRSRVTCGAGVTWGELDSFAMARGIVVPGGTVSTTGIAGLTLGGGIGWLGPLYGLTCDHLLAVEGVDGLGRSVCLDDRSAPEEMRVLRGFGHGLFAITKFIYEPSALPTSITAGSLLYPAKQAERVLSQLVQASGSCPREVNFSPALRWDGEDLMLSVDGAGFNGVGFRDWVRSQTDAVPAGDTVRDVSFVELQSMLDNPHRWGQRCSWRSVFTHDLSDVDVSALVSAAREAPSRSSMIFVERVAGAMKSPLRSGSFPLRSAHFDVLILASWCDMDSDRENISWAEHARDAISTPVAPQTYINYADRTEQAFDSSFSALRIRARATLDPDSIFWSSAHDCSEGPSTERVGSQPSSNVR